MYTVIREKCFESSFQNQGGMCMLLLWIVALVAAIVLLRYSYLVLKRLHFLRKLLKKAKEHNGSVRYYRNPMLSVFKQDGSADIALILPKKTIDVAVITTPLRRVRYHFDMNIKRLELIVERRASYVVNPRRPSPGAVVDRVYTIKKYKMALDSSDPKHPKYVVLNPAPISISKADGATFTLLYNNDSLLPDVKVSGSKWFLENVFEER